MTRLEHLPADTRCTCGHPLAAHAHSDTRQPCDHCRCNVFRQVPR